MKDKILDFYRNTERYHSAAFFSGGFIFDVATLGRVDEWSNIIMQLLYLFLCILLLAYFLWEDSQEEMPEHFFFKSKLFSFFQEWKIEAFHFAIGALMSAYTLFYFKSSSGLMSLLFLFLMILLLVLNEWKHFQALDLSIKVSMLTLCLFSFFVMIIPMIFGNFSFWYRLLALSLSLGVMGILKKALTKLGVSKSIRYRKLLFPSLATVVFLLVMDILKVIPPIPLAVQYMGVFHKVEKKYPEYVGTYNRSKWKFWQSGDQDFHAKENDRVYVFSRIFAPGGFRDKVYIRWLKKGKEGWKTSDRIPLEITGGREEGFRGYTYKSHYEPGEWVAQVETEGERVIGKIAFEIIEDTRQNERESKELSL